MAPCFDESRHGGAEIDRLRESQRARCDAEDRAAALEAKLRDVTPRLEAAVAAADAALALVTARLRQRAKVPGADLEVLNATAAVRRAVPLWAERRQAAAPVPAGATS